MQLTMYYDGDNPIIMVYIYVGVGDEIWSI